MKKVIIVLSFLLVSVTVFATRQESDLLVIDSDTLLLNTFLLEELELTYRPYGRTRQNAPSTACWRGYRAVWRISDERLFLEKVIPCGYSDSETKEQSITELFDRNQRTYTLNDGMILADWVTVELVESKYPTTYIQNKKLSLKISLEGKKPFIGVQKGNVIVNRFKD